MDHIGMSPGGESLIEDMVTLAELKRGESLLDIGCGDGDTIAVLSERYGLICAGLDRTDRADQPQPVPVLSCEHLYDAVLFECVLSTMDDLSGSVRMASKLLSAGGRLIVADLCGRNGVTPKGAIDTAELDAICRACGLTLKGREDRTKDLDTFAAEVILSYGSFEAYFNSVKCPLTAFCRLDRAAPPPGYFLAVYG
ncbi:MAG: class I SAM-dependent methyltransferase [Clostridiales Family XIII bacterium]|jgi:SAM-dependent methyltransferase|nr:class I SAM-dependent methyltransferase [Clostridiales Family XIII bacterium]